MIGTQVLVFKLKFENFIYHKIKIFTGGAYAPYAPCIRAYFKEIYGLHNSAHVRHFMKNREVASAKGAKLRLPKARSPLRLGGLGELPQRGLGRSPEKRPDFEHFMPKWSTFLALVNLIFLNNQIEKKVFKPY